MFGRKKNEVSEEFASEYDGRVFNLQKNKITVRIDEHFIRISRKGLSNLVLHGIDGEKNILIKSITAYQLKEPGKTTGYLQLIFPGSSESKGGAFDAIQDENSIPFNKNEIEVVNQIVDILEMNMTR
ncbi:DUF4429 domain-containing protein [Facklamia sp. P9177]|uniref:DUF4429 domain-containing protein n=1 Tax=Facklamia sp. P9177 TaxID=3421945 RepID=UPI003D172552